MLKAITILTVAAPLRFRVADGDATFINPFGDGMSVVDNDEDTRSSWVNLEAGTRLGFVGGSEKTNTFFFVLEGQDDRGRQSLGFGTGIVVRQMSMDKILASTFEELTDEQVVEEVGEVVELPTGFGTLDDVLAA